MCTLYLQEKNYDEETLAQQSEIEKEVCKKMMKHWVPTFLYMVRF